MVLVMMNDNDEGTDEDNDADNDGDNDDNNDEKMRTKQQGLTVRGQNVAPPPLGLT